MQAVVWQGSGEAWPGTPWGDPLQRRLIRLGWRVTVVPWGQPGHGQEERAGVLHVFSGGMEPVGSGSAAMDARLAAVSATLDAAGEGRCSVVGICLGAQMIAAVAAGLAPEPVTGGGEAGLTTLRGETPGTPDLVVPTAHVAQVPEEFLALPGVRHLWSNPVTTVQGFALGSRVVGVQFHPELTAREGRRAARSFRLLLGAPPAWSAARATGPTQALGTVLAAAGASRAQAVVATAGEGGRDVDPGAALVAV